MIKLTQHSITSAPEPEGPGITPVMSIIGLSAEDNDEVVRVIRERYWRCACGEVNSANDRECRECKGEKET